MYTLYDFMTHIKGVEYLLAVTFIAGYILFSEVLKARPFATLKESGKEDMEYIRRTGYRNTLRTVGKIAAAPFIGLAYVVSLPHMNLHNREKGKEGFYGKLLALVGYVHNDIEDNNHYMVFGSPAVYPKEMIAAEYVAASGRDNALGIIAHPDEVRDRMGQYPPYPWTDWKTEKWRWVGDFLG